MHVEWVNHASFIVEQGDVRLISDPWLQGRAFDDGWALMSDTPFGPDDFSTISHIWISHEHPDHFSPATLRSIPESTRREITVLFQETEDGKIVEFCRDLGFGNVIELPSGAWHTIADDVRVKCQPFPDDDSWIAIEAGDRLLLNLNDCMVQTQRQAESIARALDDRPIDVLATQFSYANWVGNPGEIERHRAVAKSQLERVKLQCEVFHPEFVIPFASFVWFCHQENWYLNEGMNTVRDAHTFLLEETSATPVVLYPGDRWEVGAPHDSARALDRYDEDYARVRKREGLVRSETVPLAELKQLADEFVQTVSEHHGSMKLKALQRTGLLKPAHIYLSDHDLAVGLTIPEGLRRSRRERAECDVELSSSALAYCFRHMWGGNTLLVNGRYRTLNGNFEHFRRYLLLSDLVNHDKGIDGYVRPRVGRLMDRVVERASALAPIPGR